MFEQPGPTVLACSSRNSLRRMSSACCTESFQLCVFCEFDVRNDMDYKIERSWFKLGLQTWRVNIFPWYNFHGESVFRVNSEYGNTVEPVYNGHPRDLRNWPLIFSLIFTNVTIPYILYP